MQTSGQTVQSSKAGSAELPPPSLWKRAVPVAAIVAATFVAYAATLRFGFVYDDTVLILLNKSIRSWSHLPEYFNSHLWNSSYPHLLSNAYRPFLLLWLRMNYFLFGVKPWGWHLSIVLAHVVVTYLVFRLAARLTGNRWTAAVAGLIFGLHPVHVETIAEAAWADQPLSTLFILAALLAWWRSRDTGRPQVRREGWIVASVALAIAALLSKESSLVIPLLISGLAGIYGLTARGEAGDGQAESSRSQRLQAAFLAGIPFWVVVAIYVPVRVRALKGFSYAVTDLPLSQIFLTIPKVLWFYARVLLWPVGLSCFYDTPYVTSAGVTSAGLRDFVLPVVALVVLAAGLWYWHHRTSKSAPQEAQAIAFACLWTVLTLIPVLDFRVFPQSEMAHDRYVYLPSVGFAILAAIALRQAVAALPIPLRRPRVAAALALWGVMGYATYRQTLYWSDDLTLNSHALQIAPQNPSAMTNLGAALAKRGKEQPAMDLYQRALAVNPQFWAATVNVAYVYYSRENYPEAARYFVRACSLDATDGDQFAYLGMTLLRMGRPKEAEDAVRAALLTHPQGRNYHLALSEVLEAEGRWAEARREIEWEIADDPANWQAKSMLSDLQHRMEAAPAGRAANPAAKPVPEVLK